MPPINFLRRSFTLVTSLVCAAMLLAGTAPAAGPRWSTGWPYYQNNNGNPVVWYTTQPQYFTDPGDLSAFVNHAAADAMVATAASTWNISSASLTLAQGGALNEHVSSANVYLGSSGPVFPSDVQASNYMAKQIAIIYDSDGSVTDTLLGGGASDPGNCRQSAVTESVDSISTSGQILHALLILNGRCTGSAAALQQEMEYRLIRAFGRILGLGWSQLNDNVFTGVPQPTGQQSMNWPVMHPIDILCGPYAYQCMVQPFTLRTDDMASLVSIYPVTSAGNGKTASFTNAANAVGFVNFPDGQGMEGVLVSVRRFHFGPGYTDAFDVTSGVTGAVFQQTAGSPVAPKDYSLAESNGSSNTYYEGYYSLGWIPIFTADYFDNLTVTTSAVNPLYTGQYAVGPYAPSQVTPSGPALTATQTVVGRGSTAYLNMNATSAPATCPSGGDGNVYSPLPVAASGSWTDTLCGYQHYPFSSLQVKANRSLTMEVTATDEQGYATTGKMLPVIGFWDSNDSTGSLPTLASQSAPLNAFTLGMTNLMVSNTTARTMRIGIADQRGDGRPDYSYNARILYADSISPASLPANGGVVTISGMGFHPGNTVTVNGIQANVTNWTATTITLVAPAITGPLTADVVVTDLSTGAQTTMSGALTYSQTALPDILTVISKPADGGYVGSVGSPVFKVQVMLPDGVTPASSAGVTFSSSAATFGACSGAATCTLTTDSSGYVSSAVTPTSAGTDSLTAAVGPASITTTFVALAIPVDSLTVTSLPSGTVYATLPATAPFTVKVTLPGGAAAAGAGVLITATNAALAACSGASTCTLTADASGTVSTALTPAAAGVVSLLASAGGGMVSASFGATALPADVLRIVSKPADGSYVGRTATTAFAVQVMLGENATPASGAAVTLTATGATLTACGASTCVLTADATGSVSTTVTPSIAGTVGLTASAGGGTVSTSFAAVVVPPDTLTAVSKPADGSYVGRTASIPFKVQVLLGDTGAVAAGVSVVVTTTNGVLNACNAATCTLTADSTGAISTTVTPASAGTVVLTASAGGGTLSVSFVAAVIPPDNLTILTKPANGSYVGRTAALPFAVQVFSGETGAPAAGIAVTVTASGATLAGCFGTSSCVLTADSTGTISTSVTPSAVGTVSLSASAGGGTTSTTFSAIAVPPDALHVVTQPANGSYVNRAAAIPFAVQVALGDTGAAAAGVSVTVSATNATLSACGAATCTLTADSTGTISTSVTPSALGLVTLSAAAGGGTVSTTFSAIAIPPDALHVVTQPANGSYVGRTAAIPFAVQVALGDTGAAAAEVSVTVTATNATLNACGAATCTLTADSTGTVSTSVTPSAAGTVSLSAGAGGGTVSTTFTAIAVPPDALHIVTQPANGSYVGRTAAIPFAVQVALGDTGAAAAGVSVTVTATNAVLTACGLATCALTADATGTISTAVIPSAVATVTLSASAGGGTVSTTFSAIAVPPDALHVVTQPASGSYAGRTAVIPFAVQVALGDTGAPATGASVVVTATNAVLNACGVATCTLTTNASGSISTSVTPSAAGSVGLTAGAGGGTVSTTFNAVAIPPDALLVVTQPANGSYVGYAATAPFAVQVALGDTGAPATGASVVVSATNATLNACGAATCTLIADATGTISTTVTPSAVGTVSLSASTGGGSVSTSFLAAAVPPDTINVVTKPADGAYIGRVATLPFSVQIFDGATGAPAAGAAVNVVATGATLNACSGASSCVLTADSTGTISTTLTPSTAGVVSLSASVNGGTAGVFFLAQAVPPDALTIVTQPASGSYAGRTATLPFTVQVVLGDTGAAASAVSVTVTATNAILNACGLATCTLTTDSTGTISTAVTPSAVGAVSLSASAGGGTVSTTFTAVAVPPDALHVVTQPANGSYVARTATLPFTVQVALGDTGAPASAVSVTVSATNATLGCGSATCTLTTDLTGTVSTTVTPSATGTVGLTASAGGGTVSTSFNAAAVPPDALHVLTQPANGSYAGVPAAIPFSVQALLGDTNGPANGATITLTATNATLGCGASTCALTAGITGAVSTSVTPAAPGAVGLTAGTGGGTVSTSFNAVAMPPDSLQIVTAPADNTYAGSPAVLPFSVSVLLGDGVTPASGASVTVTSVGATFAACGLSTCTIAANTLGIISTSVTATSPGSVTLTATAGGGTTSATFIAISSPDTLQVISAPSDHSFTNQAAAIPFVVKATLAIVTNARFHALASINSPDAGQIITLTAVGGKLNACGLPVCVLTTDSNGLVSTTVTPLLPGPVTLLAAGAGASISTIFAADTPPDTLHVTSTPANGSYANRVASASFAVQVLQGDGVTPAAGASVTLTATGATLGACGLATCVVTADASGAASTTVTPAVVGPVQLTASAGGGTASTSFTAAAVPPDTLHVTAQPANGSYVGRTAATPFSVQVLLGDTNGPATGASVTLTAANATLTACGLSTCTLTADATGTVSTSVTPAAAGTVTLTASAGGGTTSTSFTAAAVPPDTLQVSSQPANGSYAGRVTASPFAVRILLGDTGAPASGISVAVSATGATFGACNASTCTLTTDSNGSVSTTVTPAAAGTVTLSAAAGGGTVSTSFTSSAVPPDTLQVTSQPANGSYVARVASAPFTVQVLLGDTGTAAAGAPVTLSSTNATFTACGAATCVLTADANGTVSTTVTPSSTGLVTLTATAGGGSVSTSFTSAAVPPDTLHISSQPANGSYAARVASAPFTVQTLLGDTGAAASGASVTLTATGASLGACGLPTCTLTADANGTVSTTVTPSAAGTVQLTASAGSGTVSTSFTSASVPPDSLQVVSHPADGSFVGSASTTPFAVKILLGDTGAPAAGANVTITASNATLGACNAPTCQLTADSTGATSTTVTPIAVGPVTLTASAGGGTASSSFNAAAAPVDTLHIVSQPSGTVYVTLPAATSFAVQVMLPNGTTPVSGVAVTVSSTHATLGSCGGASSCILIADSTGTISTSVTPQQAGTVSLQAAAGGGTVSTTFTASTLPANILSVTSAPSGSQYPGVTSATRFAVHVLLGDGVTPASNAQVTLTASGASFGACTATCILTADASGNISTTVTPSASGTATLTASSGGGSVSSTFTVTPDTLHITSTPANNSYTGSPAALPFAVQVLLGDATTPVAGTTVTLTATNATMSICALSTCTLTADGQGSVSTAVTATAPGAVTLTVSAAGITASSSFNAIAPPDVLQILSTPADGSYVSRQSAAPFTVQVSLGNTANRVSGASASPNTALPIASGVLVTLSATGATFDACGLATCTLTTGTLGTVSSTVTPSSAGPVTLSAAAAGESISASFIAASLPDVLHVTSVPANGTFVGRVASAPFAVQVLQGDGITPASGVSVTLTAAGATLGACGQTTCTLSTSAAGIVLTTITPSASGTISLTATAAGTTTAASFTAATPPDILSITSTPANGSYTGRAAGTPFSVKVLLGDGVTPASAASVTLTASNATLAICGLSICTATADASGMVSTAITPAVAGTIQLTASASGGTVSASFTAVDPVRSISISRTTEYVATGSTFVWTPTVTLLENGLPVSGIAVTWSSQAGLTPASTTSVTDVSGTASLPIAIGPLASGSAPTGTVCAWATICTIYGAQAIDPSAWRLVTVSGAPQTVSPTDTLQPLVTRAVDDAGDWIAGVPMQISQLIRSWVSCPPVGRCPVGPILTSGSSAATSDADGLASITPLQIANTAETTAIVVAAGPSGYSSVSLSKAP